MEDRDHYLDRVEKDLQSILRQARLWSADASKDVHPELEAGAFSLMVRISEDQPARASDLAIAFGLSKPTMSRQLAVLENLGLIERATDPSDARSALITLSDDGIARLMRVAEERRSKFRSDFDVWSDEELVMLAESLGKLIERRPGSK